MNAVISFLLNTWFIWLPIILGFIFNWVYARYIRRSFILAKFKDENYKMLEISIPRDVHKSPQAMEMVIDILWHLGGGVMDPVARFYAGATYYPSSLEIVSIEGSIYFFIRAHVKYADLVKNTIYSQYPSAEVNEVDDYTKYVPDYIENQDTWNLYGVDFKLMKDDCIPIKTYIDYGLDKSVGVLEEEQKIDPLAPLLEQLGTLRKGEQIWIQFIVRADMDNPWRSDAKEKIKEIMGRANGLEDDDEPFGTVKLTHGEQETVKGIERSLGKFAFETVIRAVYLAPKEHASPAGLSFFKNNVFKPFSSGYFNTILRNIDSTFVDWIYQDMTGLRTPSYQRRFFNDYIKREAFDEGFFKYINFLWYKKNPPMILTSEELATLFHIPGRVSETSGVERIEAIKAEPPQNLPT